MNLDIELYPAENRLDAALRETENSNRYSSGFGLTLTETQALEVARGRMDALKAADRVEFGDGVIGKLVYAFCDSPYIFAEGYPETLIALQNTFYRCKSESGDRITDDELIELMAKLFNGKAGGSLDHMDSILEQRCRLAREGERWRDYDYEE